MNIISNINQLEEHQIRFIVKRYAEFMPPQGVINLVAEVYNIQINRELLDMMNPLVPSVCALSKKHEKLFLDTRSKVLSATIYLPVIDKRSRMKRLQQLYEKFEDEENYKMIIVVMEAARLESGPLYDELIQLLRIRENIEIKPPVYEA
ncbi:MAG: DUF2280 domain-containing protein [Balneolaceae bacterium]